MEQQDLNCKNCTNPFNLRERTPKVIPCGHTLCSDCLDNLLVKSASYGYFFCPFDSTEWPVLNAKAYSQNFCLTSLLEANETPEDENADDDDPREKELENLMEEITEKSKKLKTLVERVVENEQKRKEIFLEKEKILVQELEEVYDNLIKALTKKKEDAIKQLRFRLRNSSTYEGHKEILDTYELQHWATNTQAELDGVEKCNSYDAKLAIWNIDTDLELQWIEKRLQESNFLNLKKIMDRVELSFPKQSIEYINAITPQVVLAPVFEEFDQGLPAQFDIEEFETVSKTNKIVKHVIELKKQEYNEKGWVVPLANFDFWVLYQDGNWNLISEKKIISHGVLPGYQEAGIDLPHVLGEYKIVYINQATRQLEVFNPYLGIHEKGWELTLPTYHEVDLDNNTENVEDTQMIILQKTQTIVVCEAKRVDEKKFDFIISAKQRYRNPIEITIKGKEAYYMLSKFNDIDKIILYPYMAKSELASNILSLGIWDLRYPEEGINFTHLETDIKWVMGVRGWAKDTLCIFGITNTELSDRAKAYFFNFDTKETHECTLDVYNRLSNLVIANPEKHYLAFRDKSLVWNNSLSVQTLDYNGFFVVNEAFNYFIEYNNQAPLRQIAIYTFEEETPTFTKKLSQLFRSKSIWGK